MRGGPLVLLEVDGVIMPTRYNVNWASTKGNVLQNPDGDFMVALPCICLPRRAHDVLANYDVVGWRCDAGDPPVHYLSLTLKPGGTPILAAAAEIVATHQQAQHPTLAAPPHPEDPHAHAHAHVHAHNHSHAHAHAHPHAHAHNPAHDLQPVWPTDGLIGALQPPPVPGHFPMQPLAQPTTPLLAITGQPGGSNSGAGSDGSGFTLMTHKRVRVPVHSESSKKKYRYRLNCLQEGCDKEAVTSTSGERVYCKIHMRERGLMPKERMCQKEGCDKRAQKCAQDGLTRFCKRHMRELGMSPFEIICREEGCDKRAQSTFDGRYVYCHVHMREKGIPSKKNLCREAGCDREVQASADGQYVYCRTHMRLHGLVPR